MTSATAQIIIDFNYSLDTESFFSDEVRKTVLEAAASVLEDRLNSSLPAVSLSGSNSWTWDFTHPGLGTSTTIENPTLLENTVIIYVGGRILTGSILAQAGPAGFSSSGTTTFVNSLNARSTSSNYDPFAGVITFDDSTSWYFDTDVSTDSDIGECAWRIVTHRNFHVVLFGRLQYLGFLNLLLID